MARYHTKHKEPGWRHKRVINFSAGVMTSIVVVIFAVVKFTEGLILILFPVGVFALIRLNRQYRAEAGVLQYLEGRRTAGEAPRQPNYSRRVVIVFVDDFDLSTIAALRYARSLRPTSLRAVHFVIDTEKAEQLRAAWRPDRSVPLDFVDCPDRRLSRAAAELAGQEVETPGTQVTAILPRRTFSPLVGRLLHDRTADKMAGAVSRVPNAAAVVIPFDVQNRILVLQERQAAREGKPGQAVLAAADGGQGGAAVITAQPQDPAAETASASPANGPVRDPAKPRGLPRPGRRKAAADGRPAGAPEQLPGAGTYDRPIPPPGVDPIGSLRQPGRATVEGRVRVLEIRPVEQNSVLVAEISDSTGDLTAMFYGRSKIPGLMCGSKVRFRGSVGFREEGPVMVNPAYELIVPGTPGNPPGEG
jgi:hypothetical protein